MNDVRSTQKATGRPSFGPSRHVLREPVDRIELRMDVDSQVNEPKRLEKRIDRSHFLVIANNPKVHILTTAKVEDYSDPKRWTAPRIYVGRPDPISDLGIKVGCIVTACEMRFHALLSLRRGWAWKQMLRHPRGTWKFLVWHAAPFFAVGEAP